MTGPSQGGSLTSAPEGPEVAVDPELLEILVCPLCKTAIRELEGGRGLKCDTCHRVYPIQDDIPVMIIDRAVVEPPGGARERG